MIEILVAPGQVKRVSMLGRSQIVRDLDLDAYHVILPLIEEMDRRLRARCAQGPGGAVGQEHQEGNGTNGR